MRTSSFGTLADKMATNAPCASGGDDVAVVNLEKSVFVSAFKHKEGVSPYHDDLWSEIRRGR